MEIICLCFIWKYQNKDKEIEGSKWLFLIMKKFAEIKARGEVRIFLFAGRPIGESVARRGPFVMNSNKEVQRALQDLGFEKSKKVFLNYLLPMNI